MALIKCPECGRKNISDTAEQCPECGYAVKEHFLREERKKQIAEEERRMIEKISAENERLEPELNMKLAEIDRLCPRSKPEEPKKAKHLFYYNNKISMFSLALIIAPIMFLLCLVTKLYIFIFLFAVLIVLGIPFSIYLTYIEWNDMYSYYKKEYADWEKQTNDWEGYKKQRKDAIRKEYREIASNMAKYGTREKPPLNFYIPQTNQLKCPICGSTNVNRISTMNRTVSVATVGLASSKIGKQYECKNCKHKW